ncbi:nicotinate-nucleotide--dimethylbenzimidazole phosphoribosyltransferase [Streptomyces sp. NPDC051041]|uniref:nicotinate-nucleotide--dimethylbenzimidazole phosphoribosyltransferase n=1 Tax=Streptomyces sp. NPDC051041 TaxID=3365640 RepID=UPI0037AC2A32
MTDTGQVPGEGLPENAGTVEQPGVPAPGAYTYLSETTAEDEDLLLLPGAQGAWGNEVPPPAPEPVVEAVHEPGPHELSGRDSGSVDLGGVRLPDPAPPAAPRRPLHLGPPIPDTSASPVRSLADRGPAHAPVRQPGPPATGPEYLDVPPEAAPQGGAPWGAPTAPTEPQAHVRQSAGTVPAETVVPAPEHTAGTPDPAVEPVGAAQAVVARVAGEAAADADVQPVEAAGAPPEEAAQDGAYDVGVPQGDAHDAQAPQGGTGTPDGDAAYGAETGPDTAGTGAAPAGTPGAGADGVQTAVQPEAGRTPQAAPVAAAPVPEAPQGPAPDADEAVPAPDAAQAVEPAPAPDAVLAEPGPEAASGGDGQLPEPAPAPEAAPAEADAQALQAAPSEDAQAAGTPEPPADGPAEAPAPESAQPAEAPVAQVPEAPVAQVPGAEPFPAAPAEPWAPHPEDGSGAVVSGAPADPAAPQATPDAQPAQDPGQAQLPAVTPAAHPSETPEDARPAQEPQPAPDAQPAQGPQSVPDPAAAPFPADPLPPAAPAEPQPHAAEPGTSAPADPAVPAPAEHTAPGATTPLPGGPTPPEQPPGPFAPAEGPVPATPHLAPAPAQVPSPSAEGQQAPDGAVPVPAPREADPDVAQSADDLETRAAGQEDRRGPQDQQNPQDPEEESTAPVAEARQSTGPAAPPYAEAEREAVLKVMRERRDIRNGFRSDPIPHEVLLRVLEAAHTAPSVGHSQPWDFVVIRSAETRRTMHELAMRQREAYARSLPKGRAKQFKELKIEAILDTPVNIVVTADPTRGGRHTLGRHTQPQMAPYSAALAVENLWLAARAEGLGVGWVSFFDEREMVRALGLPEHLEVIAYLCVGYVDEFPDEPELMQAGWSKRRPLSWVVHEETYGRRALPGEEPHDLLAETVAQIRPLDAKALGEAWERQKRMTKPAGALGMLEIISAQLCGLSRQCPPPVPEPAAVAIFAGDHGVHAQGVTPWPQEVTGQMVANFLGGGAVCNAFANQVGAEVCVVDVGVAADLPATPGLLPRKIRAGTSDMTAGPAMTREEAKKAVEVGIETARDLVAAGNKALLTGEMGIANTTASAALISVFTGADPAEVTGRGTGINDETLARKTDVVRRALELHRPDPADPLGVLAAVGGFEHAAMVGLLLGGASLRTPVILDGVSAGAAALVARAIAPEVLAACIAGHRSAEPGHVAALNKLGLRPLVDLDLRLGEGTGALLALPLVQSTARAMHEVATFDSAGVTEK